MLSVERIHLRSCFLQAIECSGGKALTCGMERRAVGIMPHRKRFRPDLVMKYQGEHGLSGRMVLQKCLPNRQRLMGEGRGKLPVAQILRGGWLRLFTGSITVQRVTSTRSLLGSLA